MDFFLKIFFFQLLLCFVHSCGDGVPCDNRRRLDGDKGQGMAFQGGGMKSYTNFYAALWAMKDEVDIQTAFEDFHMSSNSGGGWFMGGMVKSGRFFKNLQSTEEDMLNDFIDMLGAQGNKLNSNTMTTIMEDIGIPDSSDLYAYAGTGMYLGTSEPWRETVHALFDDEFKTDTNFKFKTWTSLTILLTSATTETWMYYEMDNYKKHLSYPVFLQYDDFEPKCDIPGIPEKFDVKYTKYEWETWSKSYTKKEQEKMICDDISQTVIDFVGPSSAAVGTFASTKYIYERTMYDYTGVSMISEATPKALHSFAWPTIKPENAEYTGQFTYLADGGTEDDTAISGVVYRMQQNGQHSGTIIAFNNDWEIYKIFEKPGQKIPEHRFMYQTIFQGACPHESKPLAGVKHATITKFTATTVDNPMIGIKAGSVYDVIIYNTNLQSPLLPAEASHTSGNLKYKEAMKGVITDMKVLIKDHNLLEEWGLKKKSVEESVGSIIGVSMGTDEITLSAPIQALLYFVFGIFIVFGIYAYQSLKQVKAEKVAPVEYSALQEI
jgi:hypothetical protein